MIEFPRVGEVWIDRDDDDEDMVKVVVKEIKYDSFRPIVKILSSVGEEWAFFVTDFHRWYIRLD